MAGSQKDFKELTLHPFKALGSREQEGAKARGRPACSWEFTTCLPVLSTSIRKICG
jgi:hypothetical protein